ncbi:MAG: D-2-hydroxyacid dehydrogenase family protein [Candidatus Nanopelagicales bacterium]
MRIAILDDLEKSALSSADWGVLPDVEELVVLDRHVADRDELSGLLAGFDVVVAQRERTTFDRDLLERLPDLRLLVTTGPRNAAIDVKACEQLGITVSATTNEGSPVVEQAWALILGALRHVPEHDASMRSGGWAPRTGRGLEGRTLGLLGLGKTGTRMARIGAAMGMRVIAWSTNLTAERAAERGAERVEEDVLYAESDVLSVHLLLSGRTRGLVGERQLRLMKPDALLVNTSRGPIVDEEALLRACREGWIGGAALDVYNVEPLPAEHPLRREPSILLAPHTGYVTAENYRAWFGDVVDDIAAWQAGAPVRLLTSS